MQSSPSTLLTVFSSFGMTQMQSQSLATVHPDDISVCYLSCQCIEIKITIMHYCNMTSFRPNSRSTVYYILPLCLIIVFLSLNQYKMNRIECH